jgi:hypothetical protein
VKRDAERLEHGTGFRIKFFRKREAGVFGNHHPLTETAVVREETAEVEVRAEVGMAAPAELTRAARLGRINRDGHPGREFIPARRLSYEFHRTCEFMPEDEWSAQHGIADLSVEIVVEVAAADPHRIDADHHLTGSGWFWIGEFLDAQVARAVETDADHIIFDFRLSIAEWLASAIRCR